MIATRAAFAAVLFAAPAAIAAPKVVTDIPAVHSIASAVMKGVGEPGLIVAPGASPHGYAMKPSEAQALADADLVFWIGPGLAPWLETAIDTLGADATAIALTAAPGLRLLEFREGVAFEAHDHDDHDDHESDGHSSADDHDSHEHDEDKHAENKHGEHAHAEDKHADDEHGEDEHGHKESGHDGHETDPHIWLDPVNGGAMADAVANALTAADPANAAAYAANAAAFKAEIGVIADELEAALAPVRGRPFVVFHDAYHYFEARFGVEAAGAVALSDASSPGPARVEEIRALIRNAGAVCVFSEPQFDKRLVMRLIEDTGARSGELDPQGADIAPGPGLYPALLRKLGDDLAACLDG